VNWVYSSFCVLIYIYKLKHAYFEIVFISVGSWILFYCRDFQAIEETLLAPVIKALGPVANISVESQVINIPLFGKCLSFFFLLNFWY
jgi:hypothetical protein